MLTKNQLAHQHLSALVLVKALRANRDARIRYFFQECREAGREGWAPSHCYHGTRIDTDWDNICGGCEDGSDTPYTSFGEACGYDEALHRVASFRAVDQRIRDFYAAIPAGTPLPESVTQAMNEYRAKAWTQFMDTNSNYLNAEEQENKRLVTKSIQRHARKLGLPASNDDADKIQSEHLAARLTFLLSPLGGK